MSRCSQDAQSTGLTPGFLNHDELAVVGIQCQLRRVVTWWPLPWLFERRRLIATAGRLRLSAPHWLASHFFGEHRKARAKTLYARLRGRAARAKNHADCIWHTACCHLGIRCCLPRRSNRRLHYQDDTSRPRCLRRGFGTHSRIPFLPVNPHMKLHVGAID